MTNETGMDIFKAFSDLSRMDKEDFARYVVNNLANRSRERLLFYLAADFLELIQGNNDFTTKQIKKLVSLGINLGKEEPFGLSAFACGQSAADKMDSGCQPERRI